MRRALLAGLILAACPCLADVPDTLEERLKACAACHGERGEGLTKAEFYPRLAGKPAGYLFNQLVAFRDGKRRSPVMSYLVTHLSDDYLREIAVYYEQLKPPYPPPAPAPTELLARGYALATKGDASRELPPCTACHGKTLTGMQPAIPGLVGLSAHYIASQMGAWRIGQRQAYEPDCMAEIASRLTSEDVAAIAAWLGSLPTPRSAAPLTAGSLRLPLECGSASVPKPAAPAAPTGLPERAQRGEYLARAGNCFTCHTERGGAPYAGGVALPTPFGTLYSTNITPDEESGIGRWSADDFWDALHNGRSKDGSYLYPAFPFPSYTKVTREDADAIYAYLRTVQPVRAGERPHELRFPYNHRGLMALWRLLYFDAGVYEPDPKESAAWNRGAYLVQGLGHCSACHASRNVLGAVTSNDFSGGLLPAQDWYAPALSTSTETNLGGWDLSETIAFLTTGVSRRAATFGPMSTVVRHSLQHLSPADARAMATYLKSQVVEAQAPTVVEPGIPSTQLEKTMAQGARIYERHCADCHGGEGEGVPRVYPALAGNASILAEPAVNPIRIIYAGGFAPSTAGNPRPFGMPPFYQDLSDADVAAVVTYIRRSWGNAAWPVSQAEAARLRGIPGE